MLFVAALTVTVPFMPGWMSQKYVYLPVFANLTVIGLTLAASGSPEFRDLRPL
jgi:hypothetical protein